MMKALNLRRHPGTGSAVTCTGQRDELKPREARGRAQAHTATQPPEAPPPASDWAPSQGRGLAGERSAWLLWAWGAGSSASVWCGGPCRRDPGPSHTAGPSEPSAPRLVLLTCPAGSGGRTGHFLREGEGLPGTGTRLLVAQHTLLPRRSWTAVSGHRPGLADLSVRSAGPWDLQRVNSPVGESAVSFQSSLSAGLALLGPPSTALGRGAVNGLDLSYFPLSSNSSCLLGRGGREGSRRGSAASCVRGEWGWSQAGEGVAGAQTGCKIQGVGGLPESLQARSGLWAPPA